MNEMIEKLCNQIWEQQGFKKDYEAISFLSAKIYFSEIEQLNIKKNMIVRLLQSALIFSLSENIKYRKVAYEIAVFCRNIISTKNIDWINDNNSIKSIILLVFSRLGNFPAEEKYKKENNIILSNLPKGLWFERENHFIDNTIDLLDEKTITLTNFQKKLWEAVSRYVVVIVNAPTSAGKSFVLQNYVINAIKKQKIKNAIYIVPTRALIEQVICDINKIIRNNKYLKDIVVTEVPNTDVLGENNILVLTQERVQVFLEGDIKIDLVVVDEAQNVADNARGIILQSVVEIIKIRNRDTRFIFATPYVKNPDIFLNVFNFPKEECEIIPVGESPVTQNLYGITIEENNTQKVTINKFRENGESFYIVDKHTDYEIADEKRLPAIIALLVGRNKNNIIYGSDPSTCEYIAKLISQDLAISNISVDKDLEEFSNFIKEHIHKDYLLAETVKNGVAYHYGNLPSFVRKGIERLCSIGKINYIVCTSTLLQGVNLPAQNIFIMKPSRGYNNDKSPIPLSVTEFWNLAGRAGRLTKDFEGNIFLINLSNWVSNPLLEKERRQFISLSFKKYVCDPEKRLIEFIEKVDHGSGRAETQVLENAFMKLIISYSEEKLTEIFDQFGEDLSREQRSKLTSSIENAIKKITLPYEVYSKNPNISVYRQQELYDYLMRRVKEKNITYLIPPHPMREFKNIKSDYVRLFVKYSKYLEKNATNQYKYFSMLALLWMRGSTYAELLKSRIEFENQKRRRGLPNVNTEARKLFREIELSLRFKYVKFSKCYNDLLVHVIKEIKEEKYLTSIPPLHLFLELGASSNTMINLIGMGLSRTTAAQIVPHMIRTDMKRSDIEEWFKDNNVSSMGMPDSVLSEIEQIL